MDIKLLPIYFVVGGLTVAIAAYFGSQGKGLVAAFASLFPGLTLITLIAIYFHGGVSNVISYAKGTLILFPAWLLYMVGVIYLTPHLGLPFTLIASVGAYLIVAFIILRFL